MRKFLMCFGVISVMGSIPSSFAGVVDTFTEDFTSGPANWQDSTGTAPLGWASTGGPDAGPFASTAFNFSGSAADATPILFRAHDEFASSNGAFVGDWVAGNISGFSAFVLHDAPVALNYFVRFAGPSNFPGAARVFVIPVAPDTWTELTMPLPDPAIVFEGPFTYPQVFSGIGHVQIGVSAQGVAGLDQMVHFGLDKVSIVPEPATLLLLGAGALMVTRRRSSRKAAP